MMQFTDTAQVPLDIASLIKDLLKVEPDDLASLKTGGRDGEGGPLRGLGAFMRRVLELAVTLSPQKELTVRLKTEGTAKAHGWPNATVANLAMLFVWGMIQRRRRGGGLAFAALDAPAKGRKDAPAAIESRLRAMSIHELVAELEKPIEHGGEIFGEPGVYPVPLRPLIRSMLDLDSETLALYRSEPGLTSRDPETNARYGVESLVDDVLAQYKIMRERRTTTIRLMSEDDAAEVMIPAARAAHIATLLAAALHAETTEGVSFLAPRTRSQAEKAMLMETAKFVYRDYSDEAHKGFELLCDGFVHFGHGLKWTIADRMLRAVARDCDPNLEAVPYCVSMQLALGSLGAIG